MRLFDIDSWEEIIITLTRNKSRSLLTAFGIFWGIFMLVTLMGGSQGLKDFMSLNFTGFATNSCLVVSNQTSKPYKGLQRGRSWNLKQSDIVFIKNNVPEIDVATCSNARWGLKSTYQDNAFTNTTLKGITNETLFIENPKISMGRNINEIDISQKRKVCVLGLEVYQKLFPDGSNPCGSFVCIDNTYYRVVGVNGSTSDVSIQGRVTQSIQIPYSVFNQIYNMGDVIQILCFTVKPEYVMTDVIKKVETNLKRRHSIHPDDKSAVMTINTSAMFGMVDNMHKSINILALLVGIGTLLAGAIGVSNIMMVTVRERTIEIGIRRAIGAKSRDVMGQILSESMVLTILAGMTGVLLSVGVLQIMETATQNRFQISFWGAISAIVLLLTLGLVAGLAPAIRAMKVKPVDAMRDE
ncbi:MAG: ABC transporter permease [Bacteroidales bacterium]|nr:ABC transporter permease [Bacteroidales bacterium]